MENDIPDDRDNIRIIELSATVIQNQPYVESLEEGAPDTPSDFRARKVGDLYLPRSEKVEEVDFVLRNFPKGGGGWEEAIKWTKVQKDFGKLYLTNPREAFAVTKQHDLLKHTGQYWAYLVATTECFFKDDYQAVYVLVEKSRRNARLLRLTHFGNRGDWFLFRK